MNLVLFDESEVPGVLSAHDGRAVHLLTILKLVPGDRFVAGLVGGPSGTVALLEVTPQGLRLGEPEWTAPARPLLALHLLIGTPRPPTARRLMKDLTTLEVAELHFVATELGDKSYLQSTLWKGDWLVALKEGASQNRSTSLPRVERHERLAPLLRTLTTGERIVLDAQGPTWTNVPAPASHPLWLAIGPERGWSDAEKRLLAVSGWQPASLGSSILRTETACTLAAGLVNLRWSTPR